MWASLATGSVTDRRRGRRNRKICDPGMHATRRRVERRSASPILPTRKSISMLSSGDDWARRSAPVAQILLGPRYLRRGRFLVGG